MYVKNGCPHCHKTAQVFYELGGGHVIEYYLDQDFTREEFIEIYGEGATFPQCWIREQEDQDFVHIGGAKQTAQWLLEYGQLSAESTLPPVEE